MKLFTKLCICVTTLLPAMALAQTADYTLTVEADSIELGESIEITWETDSENTNRDWIGLYLESANNLTFESWKYINSNAGSFEFKPSKTGTYEFRYFLNNGYERVARSSSFAVSAADTGGGNTGPVTYELELNKTEFTVGDSIDINWETTANSFSRDWIGVYRTTASNQSFIAWKYVSGDSGTLTFSLDDPGEYEFRYFLNNGYERAARSDTFTVSKEDDSGGSGGGGNNNPASYELELDATTIERGGDITATWNTTSGNIDRDWIGLFQAGAADNRYIEWGYVNDESGSFTFTLDRAGTYEVRYFLNNGFELAAESDSFTVTIPEGDDGNIAGYSLEPNKTMYDRGEIARITWDVPTGDNFFRNWIGMYEPGDADNQYIKFEYVDIFSRTETFRLDNDGTFEFRFFTNNSYNRVAVSDQIIVSNDMTTQCTLDTGAITNFPAGNGPIIALGDSITFGIGSTAGEDYVSELSDRLGTTIINAGVSGDTTRDALARLDDDVLDLDPSAVIVFLGGNDEIRRFYEQLNNTAAERALEDQLDDLAEDLGYDWMSVPLIPRNETFANIEEIIERIQATGAVTILIGFDAAIYNAQIDDDYRTIAETTGSFFVDDIYDGIFARPRFMSDLVHPNDAGYDIVADRIQPAVACLL